MAKESCGLLENYEETGLRNHPIPILRTTPFLIVVPIQGHFASKEAPLTVHVGECVVLGCLWRLEESRLCHGGAKQVVGMLREKRASSP